MIRHTSKAIPLLTFHNLSQFSAIKHFVSTRHGGVSGGDYTTLNIGFRTDDIPEDVSQNRQLLSKTVEIPLEDFCVAQQTHSANIRIVSQRDRGKGAKDYASGIPDTDGLITNEVDICLLMMSADCTLVLAYDTVNQVIGAVHAGWKGTVQKIGQKMIGMMQAHFASNPQNIQIGIAPCISTEIYEVGEEVTQAVQTAFGTTEKYLLFNPKSEKYHFDLNYANLQPLIEVGIPAENIELSGLCTFLQSGDFFSARKFQHHTGRFGAGIMLKALP